MFETNAFARIPVPIGLYGDGEDLWTYVALNIHMPWFHVVHETTGEGNYLSKSMLFLSRVEQILFLQQQTDSTILQIDLVSPGYMNGTGLWKMEPLKEIWKGLESDSKHKQGAHVFVLMSDERYCDSSLQSPETQLQDMRLVFKI